VANLFQQATIVGVVAVGMTFVILTANIDLSVGSVVALGGMLVAVLMKAGVPPLLAGCLTVLAGAMLGLGMGAITAYAKVPSFIITLAGLVSIRGVTYLISQGTPLGGFPTEFNALGSVRVGDFAAMSFVFFGITLIAFFIFRFTVLGEYMYATGGNIHAARLSGVPARRIITLALMISGGLAGLSGVLLTSRLRIGQPTAAQGLELDAIAAVVLGGTSLFGGRGGVAGTFVAVMLLQVLRNLFNLLGLGSFYQMTVPGLIIVLAILLNKLIDSRAGGGRPNPSRSMPLSDC
jgi:ribose transport system permease protein